MTPMGELSVFGLYSKLPIFEIADHASCFGGNGNLTRIVLLLQWKHETELYQNWGYNRYKKEVYMRLLK